MWKCIRCEKENKDTSEICTECGHGRTMDYVQHRTLSKVSAKLAKNWKIFHNTEQDTAKENPNENRKNAEEFIQKKLSSLRSSMTSMKNEISKEQDEINTLHGIIEERTKLIEKAVKADKIITTISWIILIFLIVYIIYRYGFDGKITWDATKQFWGLKTDGGLDIWNILQVAATVIIVAIVCVIALFLVLLCGGVVVLAVPVAIIYLIISLLIGRFIGKVSDETLKQAETECDDAQKSIDEKKNKINSIQANAARLEYQIQRIENDREQIKDKMSMVSPEKMNEEFELWTR